MDSKTKLESLPGAPYMTYLDFDGERVDGKGGYSEFSTQICTVVPVVDKFVRLAWEHILDDFLAFNVNVTTNYSLYQSYLKNKKNTVCVCRFWQTRLEGYSICWFFWRWKIMLGRS